MPRLTPWENCSSLTRVSSSSVRQLGGQAHTRTSARGGVLRFQDGRGSTSAGADPMAPWGASGCYGSAGARTLLTRPLQHYNNGDRGSTSLCACSFWEKAPDNETGDRKVVRVRWGDKNEPIVSEPGQDGWYFDIDVSRGQASVGGRFNSLLKANAFALCSSKEADLPKCRQFSGAKFDQAVSFVCGRR